MEEQRPVGGVLAAQGVHPAHDDEMVAARVHRVDRAVDPRERAREAGDPDTGAASYATPANLSAPLTAKARHNSPWPALRTFTQKTPARAMRGQLVDVRPTMKATRGGSREREEKDWQAKPACGSSVVAGAVTTTTPVAKCPSTRRKSACGIGARSSSPTHRSSGRGRAATGGASADLR